MDFRESLKVDQGTLDRLNDVSQKAADNMNNQSSHNTIDDGGMEKGDSGPASQGRTPGYKMGENNSIQNVSDNSTGIDGADGSDGSGTSVGNGAEGGGTGVGAGEGGIGSGGEGGIGGDGGGVGM